MSTFGSLVCMSFLNPSFANDLMDSTNSSNDQNKSEEAPYTMKTGVFGMGFDAAPAMDLALNAIKIQTDTGARASQLSKAEIAVFLQRHSENAPKS